MPLRRGLGIAVATLMGLGGIVALHVATTRHRQRAEEAARRFDIRASAAERLLTIANPDYPYAVTDLPPSGRQGEWQRSFAITPLHDRSVILLEVRCFDDPPHLLRLEIVFHGRAPDRLDALRVRGCGRVEAMTISDGRNPSVPYADWRMDEGAVLVRWPKSNVLSTVTFRGRAG